MGGSFLFRFDDCQFWRFGPFVVKKMKKKPTFILLFVYPSY